MIVRTLSLLGMLLAAASFAVPATALGKDYPLAPRSRPSLRWHAPRRPAPQRQRPPASDPRYRQQQPQRSGAVRQAAHQQPTLAQVPATEALPVESPPIESLPIETLPPQSLPVEGPQLAPPPHAGYGDGGYVDGGYVDGGYVDGGYVDGGYVDGGYFDGGCADGGCSCGGCGGCPAPGCYFIGDILSTVQFATLELGIQGFKGPLDEQTNGNNTGNFGFHEGFNIGGALPMCGMCGIGYQVGWQAMQTNLSGTLAGDDSRDQSFFTVGMYHRVPIGFQWGFVWDHLHDDYFDEVDVDQFRIEVSLVGQDGSELGLTTAFGTGDDRGDVTNARYEATDQYLFFYRWQLDTCGEARLLAGFSGASDGIVGLDARLPLNNRWALLLDANYLIPDESSGPSGALEESWNLGMSLAWHYGCAARSSKCNPFRPLFDLADNGNFFVDRHVGGQATQ